MNPNKNKYFAQEDSEILVSYLKSKSKSWFDHLNEIEYLDKIKRSWLAYTGIYYDNSHQITFGGETGELVNFPVNHFRNIATHILNMVTATRPSFQAKAANTDSKSTIQTNLANSLLEYYMRDKRLEVDIKKAVEYAIVLGSGYIKMDWNSTSGEIHDTIPAEIDVDEEGNEIEITPEFPIYEGDVEFSVLSPYDVVFDSTKENSKHDWQICRTFKNKYDLMAKYPDLAEQISSVQTKSEANKHRVTLTPYDETVDVPVYEFFHRPTESLPKGRYIIYLLNPSIVLHDSVLPYRKLPIFRIAYADILGTPFGYTQMFDLLPIQQMLNATYSTIATNQNAFGVQNIWVERGANLSVKDIGKGLTIFEGEAGTKPPMSINLTNTPKEIFDFAGMLQQNMETISGMNSVARGNPEANLRTGNALALVLSQAIQYVSNLQQSYIHLIEDVGTNLISLLQDFAKVPRIAYIVGQSNSSYLKEFTGDDLSYVRRVIVDAGNALANTVAGKTEIAAQMIRMGVIKTPEEYQQVITTGKIENMTEGLNKQLILIRQEREALINNDPALPVSALLTDEHYIHIKEHTAILSDMQLRNDPDLIQRTLAHIQEHIDILSDPNVASFLIAMGIQPIQPPQPPVPPTDVNQADPQAVMENPEAQSLDADVNIDNLRNANQPRPAGQFENNPVSAQEAMASMTGGNVSEQ